MSKGGIVLGLRSLFGGVGLLSLFLNRPHSARPNVPTFHYSTTPLHPITPRLIIADLSPKTIFSVSGYKDARPIAEAAMGQAFVNIFILLLF
jgi:hypothetical protein